MNCSSIKSTKLALYQLKIQIHFQLQFFFLCFCFGFFWFERSRSISYIHIDTMLVQHSIYSGLQSLTLQLTWLRALALDALFGVFPRRFNRTFLVAYTFHFASFRIACHYHFDIKQMQLHRFRFFFCHCCSPILSTVSVQTKAIHSVWTCV